MRVGHGTPQCSRTSTSLQIRPISAGAHRKSCYDSPCIQIADVKALKHLVLHRRDKHILFLPQMEVLLERDRVIATSTILNSVRLTLS